jgi:DNA polymerase
MFTARTITKADEKERFVAKTGVLSLGFQAGAQKFYDSMRTFGIDDITLKDAHSVVNTYRNTYPKIPELWRKMERLKESMITGASFSIGPVHSCKERIRLPNGMYLTYPQLVNAGGRYKYKGGMMWKDVYGGKLTENVVQALARIVMTTAELRLADAGLRAALSVHDELVFVVKDEYVETVVPAVRRALTFPVSWMPELPINCEIGVGDNYGDAK